MSDSQIFKVSVLTTNELLLDGEPATLTDLEQSLARRSAPDAVVWYYREDANGHAPPIAEEVLKLIAIHRLPIRLSARADFSVNNNAATPLADAEQRKRLEVDERFRAIREKARQHQLVVVRPDDRYLFVPAMKTASPERVASVERLLPSNPRRNVAVLADTAWSLGESVGLQAAHQAIPFFGILMAFTYIGHAVWVFDGSQELLSAGCKEADMLIVDDRWLPVLQNDWESIAREVMTDPQIYIHDRATFQLRKLG